MAMTDEHKDDDDDDMCPICFIHLDSYILDEVFVLVHVFIGFCSSRMPNESSWLRPNLYHYHCCMEARPFDPYLYVPTLGRCPICRCGWSLFDLQNVDDKDNNSESAAETDGNDD
jgi:hypothetical protein